MNASAETNLLMEHELKRPESETQGACEKYSRGRSKLIFTKLLIIASINNELGQLISFKLVSLDD